MRTTGSTRPRLVDPAHLAVPAEAHPIENVRLGVAKLVGCRDPNELETEPSRGGLDVSGGDKHYTSFAASWRARSKSGCSVTSGQYSV